MQSGEEDVLALRVLARLVIQHRAPLEYVVELDEDGNEIRDPFKRYGDVCAAVPRKMGLEEWSAKYAPKDAEAARDPRPENTIADEPTLTPATSPFSDEKPKNPRPEGVRRRSRYRE